MYQIEFAGDVVTELTANDIAESVYSQYNADGNVYLILDLLVDNHKNSKAVSLTDQQTSIQSRPVTCEFIVGWQICCKWKDSSTSWEKMSKLKKSHPVQTAEFAVAQVIDHESACNWLVKMCSRKETE